jgi:uncharacterized membrane protein YedE/YeeE
LNVVNFTPYSALAGGALIGIAAVLLLWLNGRIAGVSGILAGVVTGAPDWRVRLAFLVGLIAGAGLYYTVSGNPPPLRSGFPAIPLALAGVLVGFGTAWSGGCTSGHGVCGISRFSLRSVVATVAFMAVAIATTYVVRHVLGLHW